MNTYTSALKPTAHLYPANIVGVENKVIRIAYIKQNKKDLKNIFVH